MKLKNKKIPKFGVVKMLMVLFMVLWFGSPTIAQGLTSEYPCFSTLLQGDCAPDTVTSKVNYSVCCPAISKKFESDQECMCNAFNLDTRAVTIIVTCLYDYNVPMNCTDSSSFSPPTPDTLSPPASSTTPFGSNSPSYDNLVSAQKTIYLISIVVPVVIIAVIIIIGVCICCICRPKPKIIPNAAQYYPPYIDLIKDQGAFPSPNVTVGLTPSSAWTTGSTATTNSSQSYPAATKSEFVTADSLEYQLATIQTATNNFSADNKLGHGSFGFVYKGILPDRTEIAVKRLSKGSKQGDVEFKAEIELLAKLQHRNLVKLLGFCSTEDERILVYELMPNSSLDYYLFGNAKGEELKWPIRYKIIKGIARGILYLHVDSPLRIIHRDLKPANVLLDATMNPKIADFGTARICDLGQTHVNTTKPIGTPGYMSPEYGCMRQFSVKSDVFALGVIILEVISGRRIINNPNNQSVELSEDLMSCAWRCWREEKPLALIDPLLKDIFSSKDEIVKCVHLGLLCLQDDPRKRPDMSTIVHTLNSDYGVVSLPAPQYPLCMTTISPDQSGTTQSNAASTGGYSGYSQFKSCR